SPERTAPARLGPEHQPERPAVDDARPRQLGDARGRGLQLGGLPVLRRQPAARADDESCGCPHRRRDARDAGLRHDRQVRLLEQPDVAGGATLVSKLLRTLRAETGQAMMMVVFTTALLSTLAVGLTSLVTSESQSAGHSVSSEGAYQAAESGID